jgi:GNAT superfamily N-acetyltransferase
MREVSPSMIIRKATPEDSPYLAEACVSVIHFMRQEGTDKYITGFPDAVNDEIVQWAGSHAQSEDRIAFIAEDSEVGRIGCIFGSIEQSNLPMAVSSDVGSISVCWVEPHHQKSGIGRSLLTAIESWFRSRGIVHLEVAYMAKNATAQEAWRHLGFIPFRVFAYKEIRIHHLEERSGDVTRSTL